MSRYEILNELSAKATISDAATIAQRVEQVGRKADSLRLHNETVPEIGMQRIQHRINAMHSYPADAIMATLKLFDAARQIGAAVQMERKLEAARPAVAAAVRVTPPRFDM